MDVTGLRGAAETKREHKNPANTLPAPSLVLQASKRNHLAAASSVANEKAGLVVLSE